MKTTILVVVILLLPFVPIAYGSPVTYYYSGHIFHTYTSFSSECPFTGLVGQKFTGNFTYDSDLIGPYFSDMTNFYAASSASFHIGTTNYINFMRFDWQPLGLTGNDLFLYADSSATQGHVYDWKFDHVDEGKTYFSFYLSFMGAPSGQFLYESLKQGSLNETDFTEYGVTVFVNGQPYPVSKYLHLQLVETIGPELGDLKYHNLYGDIEYLSINPVPEPGSAYLLLTGLIPFFWFRKMIRTSRSA